MWIDYLEGKSGLDGQIRQKSDRLAYPNAKTTLPFKLFSTGRTRSWGDSWICVRELDATISFRQARSLSSEDFRRAPLLHFETPCRPIMRHLDTLCDQRCYTHKMLTNTGVFPGASRGGMDERYYLTFLDRVMDLGNFGLANRKCGH